jgi:hypothetical protein
MAEQKQIIAGTVQVDTSKAQSSVKALNKDLKDVKGSLTDTGNAATGASKDVSQASGSFSNIRSQISGMPGPLGQAATGVKGLGGAFKALIANPVGLVLAAIVLTLTALYKAFTSTNDGADKMEQVFAGLNKVAEVVRNTILKLAGAVVKLFSGDFSGALADGKAAVSEFGWCSGKSIQ